MTLCVEEIRDQVGRLPLHQSIADLSGAVEAAQVQNDAGVIFQLQTLLGHLLAEEDVRRGAALIDGALKQSEVTGEDREQAVLWLASCLVDMGEFATAVALVRQHSESGRFEKLQGLRAWVLARLGHIEEAIDVAYQMPYQVAGAVMDEQVVFDVCVLGYVHHLHGAFDQAFDFLRLAQDGAQFFGHRRVLVFAQVLRAQLLFDPHWRGHNVSEARRLAKKASLMGWRDGWLGSAVLGEMLCARIALTRGDEVGAVRSAENAVAYLGESVGLPGVLRAQVWQTHAAALDCAGRGAAALQQYQRAQCEIDRICSGIADLKDAVRTRVILQETVCD